MNWRLSTFGLVFGLFLATLVFSFGPGIIVGPGAFIGLAVIIVGPAIFSIETSTDQRSSKLRAFSEWTPIGVVWILIALIILGIKSTLALERIPQMSTSFMATIVT